MQRGLIAEIDHYALAHNYRVAKDLVGKKKVIAVVKADAYGHGIVEVSKTLIKAGADMLAVAYTSEGRQLREAGVELPILCIFDPDVDDIHKYSLTPVVSTINQARRLDSYAYSKGTQLSVHLKIDTGMGRIGFHPEDTDLILDLFNYKHLKIIGAMSHFSDADMADKSYAVKQIERFIKLKAFLAVHKIDVPLWHMANSAALISLPESRFDAVRPGIMLYGICPMSDTKDSVLNLRPVMSVKTQILQLRSVKSGSFISYGRTFVTKRDSLIAVLPVGYADGINRLFSNNLEVLVCGKRVPVVGRVCMDTTMVDVTDVEDVQEGSEVVLLGSQGKELISANELADRIGTISYEILTSMGNRARRQHLYLERSINSSIVTSPSIIC